MKRFKLVADFEPQGDQPEAVKKLVEGIEASKKSQVLLGITGSGKTFTMAQVIAQVQRPTLILAHNKTLAAQLYQEFKAFFPENGVEYFVSYYDYYKPEAYLPHSDTYVEKEMAINDQIDRMRLSATRSLIERQDVIIIASASCIYGIGLPEYYSQMQLTLKVGERRRRDQVLLHLLQMRYKRDDKELIRATFQARGELLEIMPAYEESIAYRIEWAGEEIRGIEEIEAYTGKVTNRLDLVTIFPGSHHVTSDEMRDRARETIREELQEHHALLLREGRDREAERLFKRTTEDLAMMREMGFCKGIENYSRHFSGRPPGGAPPCLIDYFPSNFLLFVDESHQTIPQLHAMYNGDRARKKALIQFGFRLPSAFDNRPLKFEEFYRFIHQVIYVSATPGSWEVEEAGGEVIEQIIRPTGLLDPHIEVRSALTQVEDALREIRSIIEKQGRVLVTTLTKKLAEDLAAFLTDIGVKARYLHADIDTLERIEIINALRRGTIDVLIGINLLREGLDIPEVSLVIIFDADRRGFLRSATSLIQTCGRAARNVSGRVIMYADVITPAIQHTLELTSKRRMIQEAHNQQEGITPRTAQRRLIEDLVETFEGSPGGELLSLNHEEIGLKIEQCIVKMKQASREFRFKDAANHRDLMRYYQKMDHQFNV